MLSGLWGHVFLRMTCIPAASSCFGKISSLSWIWAESLFLTRILSRPYEQYLQDFEKNEMSTYADLYFMMTDLRLPSTIDLALVKKELVAASHRHHLRGRMPSLPFQERSLEDNAFELTRIAGAHRFEINWNLLKMGRWFGVIDQNVGVLKPNIVYNKKIARYLCKTAECKERPFWELMPKLLGKMELYLSVLRPTLLSCSFQFGSSSGYNVPITGMILGFLRCGLWGVLFVVVWIFLYQHCYSWIAPIYAHRNAILISIKSIPHHSEVTWSGLNLVLTSVNFQVACWVKHLLKLLGLEVRRSLVERFTPLNFFP